MLSINDKYNILRGTNGIYTARVIMETFWGIRLFMKGYSDSPAFVSGKVAETKIPKLSYHNNINKYMASY